MFVSSLGDVVLDIAEVFFTRLAHDSEIGSLALADAIGVASPRNIPAVLTTPLKKRAKALSLPLPGPRTLTASGPSGSTERASPSECFTQSTKRKHGGRTDEQPDRPVNSPILASLWQD